MNLEIPKKFYELQNAATLVAKNIFRPISRKYDVAEHDYPVELDLLASGLNGLNDGSDAPIGGTNAKSDSNTDAVKNGANMANCVNIQALCYGDVGLLLSIPGQGLGNAAINAVANKEQLEKFSKS